MNQNNAERLMKWLLENEIEYDRYGDCFLIDGYNHTINVEVCEDEYCLSTTHKERTSIRKQRGDDDYFADGNHKTLKRFTAVVNYINKYI